MQTEGLLSSNIIGSKCITVKVAAHQTIIIASEYVKYLNQLSFLHKISHCETSNVNHLEAKPIGRSFR